MPKLGYIQSNPDPRDFIYSQMMAADVLPPSFFHPRIPVNEQIIGDCVGQSARAIKAIQEGRGLDFSPDFVYAECKKLDGMPDVEGTEPRVAMKVLKDIGAARKGMYKDLTVHNLRTEPSAQAYEDAKEFVVNAYARIQTVDEIKHALVHQGPVMAAMQIVENFVECEEGGLIDIPTGRMLGGHAVAIDGYDDNMTHTYKSGVKRKGFFRFVNSWGTDWGDQGYGWLPYDYVNLPGEFGFRFFQEAWSSVDSMIPPKDACEVIMWLDKNKAIVDGREVILDQAPIAPNGRTLVPVRFLSESLGWTVDFDSSQKKITLRK